jgi:hypothetical protein
MVTPHGFVILLAMLGIMASVAGCRKGDERALKRETSHVRLLSNLHVLASSKLGHVPRDEQEFKQAIAALSVSPEKLKVASIDELFISERDGQPLVVVYGTPSNGSDVVVYEQKGANGKRQVGHRIGLVEEVDEAGFQELAALKQ